VTISGAGSAWTSGNGVAIGSGGTGTLSILDGGKATFTGYAILGDISYLYDSIGGSPVLGVAGQTGAGYVTVSGAGSALTLAAVPDTTWGTGYINVGYDGTGALTVNDGGAVTAPGGIWIGPQGSMLIGGQGDGDALLAPGTVNTPSVVLQDPAASLVFEHDATDYTFGAAISGNGNLFAQGGFTRLSGDSSAFAGGVIVNGGATLDVTGQLGGTLLVGNAGAGTLQVSDGGSMHATGNAIIASAPDSGGNVVVSGAGSTFVVDGAANVGYASAGGLSVLDGGTASIGLTEGYSEVLLGFGDYGYATDAQDGVGTVVVDGAGSTLNYAGGMNVLNGSATISNGGHLTSQVRAADSTAFWIDVIGYGLPANPDTQFAGLVGTGDMTVTGAGSAWASVNSLQVGYGGNGTLSILDGGTATFHGQTYVGEHNGSQIGTGTVIVAGTGSKLTLIDAPVDSIGGPGWLDVGSHGEGTLDIRDGGTVAVANTFYLGDHVKGTLDIESGGSMTVAGFNSNGIGMVLAAHAGGTGSATVTGAGSVLTAPGAQIGSAGSGTLTVLDGGTVNLGLNTAYSETILGFGYYGWGDHSADGVGTVSVSGAGSTLNYAGGFNVLNGTTSIANGGQLVSHTRAADGAATFWIDQIGWGVPANPDGSFAGLNGNGDVNISGAGSTWSSVNALNLGNGGTGSLSVLDGGKAGFIGFADLGGISYLYDSIGGSPVPDLAGQTGTGNITVSGAGSALTIAAIPGNTTWGTGSIDVGVVGAGSLTVNDGGTVTAPGGIHVGEHGAVVVGGLAGDGTVMAPGGIDTPTMTFDAPTSTLTFQHSGELYVFDAALSGNGHIDAIGGFTRLTADSSAFTGTTTVDTGATLSVNGSLGGDILVTAQGTLQGTGTVNNVTVAGILAPGNSPGTLHVDGDLVMQTGSVYQAQIDPETGVSDSVAVAGNVTIEPGTTLDIQNLGSQALQPGANIQLIQTTSDTGTVAGQFDSTVGAVSAFVGYGVSYEDGKINIAVQKSDVSFASVGDSPAMQALGGALDGVSDTSALGLLLFSQITTPEQAAAAFGAMGGTMNADLRRVMLDDSRLPRDTIDRHLRQADNAATRGTAYWVQAMGHWGSADADGDTSGARSNGSGVMVGIDTGIGDATRIGIAAGSGQTSYDMQAQDAHVKTRHVALYGRSTWDAFGLDYGVASAWHAIRGTRRFAIGTAQQLVHGDHDARTDQVFVDAGYRLGDNAQRYAEPFVALAHVRLHNEMAKETGGAAALATRSGSDGATFSTLGLRWTVGNDTASWYGSVGWRHASGFDRTVAVQSFVAGGAAFETIGLPMARNALALELGTQFDLSKNVHFAAGYTGQLSSSARDHGAQMTLTVDL
jgi:outer membrane autotransporter protein